MKLSLHYMPHTSCENSHCAFSLPQGGGHILLSHPHRFAQCSLCCKRASSKHLSLFTLSN